MNIFLSEDIVIEKIVFASMVKSKYAKINHRNRRYHGFVFMPKTGSTKYDFIGIDRSITIESGELLYLPKGSDYDVCANPDGICYAINFEITQNIASMPFKQRIKDFNRMLNLFENAAKENAKNSKNSKYNCKSILYEIMAVINENIDAAYTPTSKSALISPAISYIENNYFKEIISMTKLAELCGISDCYLRRLFQSVYNTSPSKYIQALRISRAKKLIVSGMYSSLYDIAFLSGYNDYCSFSREFHKIVGVSPKAYEKNRF